MKSQRSKVKGQKLQRGFTLLESMVAIAIFTVGVSTAVFVITQSINVGTRTKNKIIAANLTQEGIEVVRNMRDRNWFAGRAWTDGMADLTDACLQYDSDNVTGFFIDDSLSCSKDLFFDGAHYVKTASPAQFSRTITTELIPADTPSPGDPERLKITSSVTCGVNCSITAEDYLYNWK